MRFALLSLEQAWQDREVNLERCARLLAQAADQRCVAAALPEMTLTGYSMAVETVVEDPDASVSLDGFGRLAAETRIHLLFGACLRDGATAKPRNVFCHATPDGAARVVYAKTHPFSFVGEDEVFEPGEALGFVSLQGFRVGASICYDLRFPGLYAAMAASCQGVVCIANWPKSRVAHWHALLVARAIENQLYMFGVNRTGIDGNGFAYARSSVVVTPEGTLLQPVHSAGELEVFEIDVDLVGRYRASFPTLRDRRPNLYQNIASAGD